MTVIGHPSNSTDGHRFGVLFVFGAGVLWSTVGLGIRLIEDALVWQILLYRSVSLSLLLYLFIRMRSGESPFAQIRCTGFPAAIAGLALVAAYSGGIYAIQSTSVANAMLLFATAPFMAAVLGGSFCVNLYALPPGWLSPLPLPVSRSWSQINPVALP